MGSENSIHSLEHLWKEPARWDEEKTINFLLHENWGGHFGLKMLERNRNRRLFLEKCSFNWNLNESLIQK